MTKKKEAKKKTVPRPKIKINKYKCDKCGGEFSVSELEFPTCPNPDCKSTCTQQLT